MNHTEISVPLPSPAEITSWSNTQSKAQATRAANARSTSGRRRLVDPTTCDREYTSNELEFMQAIQEYKKKSGRMFPTWSEVLEVLQGLGYRKADNSTVVAPTGAETE